MAMPSATYVVPQGLDTEGKDAPDQAGDQPAMCIQGLSQREDCRQGRASYDACPRIPAGEELLYLQSPVQGAGAAARHFYSITEDDAPGW